tara:strand:+ start:135 stop:401 length:267 start_codon:yes stop_codon:yes gene_type:complete
VGTNVGCRGLKFDGQDLLGLPPYHLCNNTSKIFKTIKNRTLKIISGGVLSFANFIFYFFHCFQISIFPISSLNFVFLYLADLVNGDTL